MKSSKAFTKQLHSEVEDSEKGVFSKVLFKDDCCQYTLLSLAENTEISEHASTRNATVNVIEGGGMLTLEGREIPLEQGVFVFMPANAPHALKAHENLLLLLTLSEHFSL